MNVFTAPLQFLYEFTSDNDLILPERQDDGRLPDQPSNPLGGGFGFFVASATVISIAVIGGGFYLLLRGGTGDVTLSGVGVELSTKTAGIAVLAIGLAFYLLVGSLSKAAPVALSSVPEAASLRP